MRAKEFMEQVRRASRELVSLHAMHDFFTELAVNISAPIGAPTGARDPAHSRVEDGAVRIVDLATELDVKIQEYTDLVHKAQKLIAKVPGEKHRQFLTLYYVCGWSMKHISDELRYDDEKSVYRLRGWALQKLQKVM